MHKFKILALCDSPTGSTGFSTVAKNIFKYLHEEFEIDIVGVNQREIYYDREVYPYRIYGDDLTGDFGIGKMCKLLSENQYDILFTIDNLGITERIQDALYKLPLQVVPYWVAYIPIEQDYLVPSQYDFLRVEKTRINKLVLYHPLAQGLLLSYLPSLKSKTTWIPHGTNTEDFYPLSDDEKKQARKEMFGLTESDFLISNINFNQWRKNLWATIYAFLLAKAKNKNDDRNWLYLHTPIVAQGGNLLKQIEVAKELVRLKTHVIPDTTKIITPDAKFRGDLPVTKLNQIYNASDLIVSTSFGEGWGLTTTEAMATKTPVLVPKNTSFKYIADEGRGNFILTSILIEHPVMPYGSSDFARAYVDIINLAAMFSAGLDRVWETEKAYNWVSENSWENIAPQWINLFKEVGEYGRE